MRSTGIAPAECERSQTTCGRGERGHVGDLAGAVADVREHHQRRVLPRRLLRRVDEAQLAAAAGGEPFEHVAVGGEVAAVGDDRALARLEHGGAQLVEVDGGRVAGDHLAGARAEDVLGEQVADPRGRVDPVVPAGDELAAPLRDGGGEPVARGQREAAERVAVEVDPGSGRHRRTGLGRPGGDRPRPARRPRRGSWEPIDHRLPQRVLGIEVPVVVFVGEQHEVAAGGAVEGLAHRGRDGVVLAAVCQQRGHAERQPRGGRGRGVALGVLLGRAAQQPPHDAVGEPPLPRALEVEHARLGHHAGDLHARPVARRRERREVAARGVADRDHAREVERRLQHAQVVDARAEVVERGRPAAAALPAQPPVLEVPHRPAAPDEVVAQRVHQLAAVLRLPEAAVEEHRDRERGGSSSAGRNSSPNCECLSP